MPRKGLRPRDRREAPAPDYKYNSVLVSRFVNRMNFNGKKTIGERILYDAMDILAEKTRYFKKNEKGEEHMCKIMEELAAEERAAISEEIAMNLLKIGKMTNKEIAAAANLTERKVKKLAEKLQVVTR